MEPISVVLTIIGLTVPIGIAWWQHRKAVRAESAVRASIDAIPQRVIDEFEKIVSAGTPGRDSDVLQLADVNGDGRGEVLIQGPAGAHGWFLKAFGWGVDGIHEIVDLRSDTPCGFEIGDFDHDGRLEVRTKQTEWSKGLSYGDATRGAVTYRWDGKGFAPAETIEN